MEFRRGSLVPHDIRARTGEGANSKGQARAVVCYTKTWTFDLGADRLVPLLAARHRRGTRRRRYIRTANVRLSLFPFFTLLLRASTEGKHPPLCSGEERTLTRLDARAAATVALPLLTQSTKAQPVRGGEPSENIIQKFVQVL